MTKTQLKYEKLSKPILRTKNQNKANRSIFEYRYDSEKEDYYTTWLGIYNGFLGLFGYVMYYLPDTDRFETVRRCW